MKGQKGPMKKVRIDRHQEAGGVERVWDALAVEEPLEIRLQWRGADGAVQTEAVAVTMRTPGDDFELVAGFLHGEGIVPSRDLLHEMTYCRDGKAEQAYNVVEARLRPGVSVDLERLRRNFYTTSSCGVCGKVSLDAVEAQGCAMLPSGGVRVDAELVPLLPERLSEAQGVFQNTGGLHAAGFFGPQGELVLLREDVGRHNAVDKAVGTLLLDGRLPASDRVLVVSGRASFEIVQKTVAVGAPSSLAVELAGRFGQTLVGFARDGRFNVYTGGERIA